MVPAVGGIAVGPFFIEGQIKAEIYNSSTIHHNVICTEASNSLISELIEFFSFTFVE